MKHQTFFYWVGIFAISGGFIYAAWAMIDESYTAKSAMLIACGTLLYTMFKEEA